MADMNLKITITAEAKKLLEFWAVLENKTHGQLASQAIMKAAPIKAHEFLDDLNHAKSLPPKRPESVAGFGLPTVDVHEACRQEAAQAQENKQKGFKTNNRDFSKVNGYENWATELVKSKVDLSKPIKEDPASQELIRRWTEDKVSSREMASWIGRSKSSINDYRKLHIQIRRVVEV
jgi:hypothetical protein